jgi:hypothetical protein
MNWVYITAQHGDLDAMSVEGLPHAKGQAGAHIARSQVDTGYGLG